MCELLESLSLPEATDCSQDMNREEYIDITTCLYYIQFSDPLVNTLLVDLP